MSIVDLASDHHEWLEAAVAGAEQKVSMYPLHVDLQRGTRSVLLTFPAGWERTARGTQPAGEEFVPISGALEMSGVRVEPGHVLVVTPRALRHDTSSADATRAVVFYTGPGGGWKDGDAIAAGEVGLRAVEPGVVREPTDGLVGSLELLDELPEDGFDKDCEVVWIEALKYAFIPRGGLPPEVDGRVLVRFLG